MLILSAGAPAWRVVVVALMAFYVGAPTKPATRRPRYGWRPESEVVMLRTVLFFIAGIALMAMYATKLHEREPSYVPDLKTFIGVAVIAVVISLLVRWFQKS